MKIAFVTSHLTVFGGGGKFLMDYANNFYERGHNITIVTQKIDKDYYKFNDNISLIEVGGPLPSKPKYWLRFNKIKKEYLKVLNKLDVDLLISQYFPSNYFCSKTNKRNNLKHVYYCFEPYRYFHDREFYSNAPFFLKIATLFIRTFFKKYDIEGVLDADEVISISNFTKERVKKWYGVDSHVHHIGVSIDDKLKNFNDFDFKKELGLREDTLIIFSLGLSHHFKGTRELMYIFNKILKSIPEAILLIGGKIKKENYIIIKKLKKKLKIPNKNIILYGFIESDLLDLFYISSRLTLYTALDEAFGLIPLESMKNGTPVIAFEGGPSETIIDGNTGYVIKNGDIDDFAQKAINLIKDKKLREEFSKNAKKHIKNNYSYNTCIPNLESILLNILSNK